MDLAGVADIYNQEQQQKAIRAFNKVHADAWASGDPSANDQSLPRKIQRLLHRHNRRFPVLMSSNATIRTI